MATIHVRQAGLDDTSAICALYRTHITVWQRVNARGGVEDVPYEALTIYERWLHGGPWMSVETAAIHLSHLLLGAGLPLVAERDGALLGYAEAYHGHEPAPYGDHLHIGSLTIHADHIGSGLEDALFTALLEHAQAAKYARLTAIRIGLDETTETLYRRHGMSPISRLSRFSLPAKSGQGFYKAVDHPDPDAAQIDGWYMPVGRGSSARQIWENLWPRTWDALPEIAARRTHRLHLSAAGQEAYVCCQQGLYAPRNADLYLWSPKPLTGQLLTALRDWTHREGYRTLVLLVPDEAAPILGTEAEPDGYFQSVYGVDI
jgi:ribosomal protein S18 acetylase RimI-like enzyme